MGCYINSPFFPKKITFNFLVLFNSKKFTYNFLEVVEISDNKENDDTDSEEISRDFWF